MALQTQLPGRTAPAAAASRFSGFKPDQDVYTVRTHNVEGMPALAKIFAAWEKFTEHAVSIYILDSIYLLAKQCLSGIGYNAKDVWGFSIAFHPGYDRTSLDNAGIFISALINEGNESNYRIDMRDKPKINHLGYRNRKNVLVNGNIGTTSCFCMESGTFEVHGDAESNLAMRMGGGTILLHSDQPPILAQESTGGEVYLLSSQLGDFSYAAANARCRIYRGDVLVWDENGKVSH